MKKSSENNINILLSINLLTYNQPNDLKRTLESLLPQITNEVEVIVNDNGDDLETQTLVKKYPNIKYFKNNDERNVDTNILNSIKRSTGEYVWIFGDDEFEPNAIGNILKILKDDYNFVYTNSYINEQGYNNPVVRLDSDEIVYSGNEILEKVSNCLGFMSSSIMKKKCLESLDYEKMKPFMGNGYINFYIVIHCLSIPGKFYISSCPYVHAFAVPAENQSDKYKKDAFRSFVVDTFDIIGSFKGKFNKKSVKKLLAKNFGHIWRGMLVGIVNKRGISKGQIKLLFKYYWNFPEFWIALPFFLMPRFINVFFYKLYKKLAGNELIRKKISNVPWF